MKQFIEKIDRVYSRFNEINENSISGSFFLMIMNHWNLNYLSNP